MKLIYTASKTQSLIIISFLSVEYYLQICRPPTNITNAIVSKFNIAIKNSDFVDCMIFPLINKPLCEEMGEY